VEFQTLRKGEAKNLEEKKKKSRKLFRNKSCRPDPCRIKRHPTELNKGRLSVDLILETYDRKKRKKKITGGGTMTDTW